MEEILIQFVASLTLLLVPAWKIYCRAGLNPWLSLTIFIPIFGLILCPLLLAGSDWKLPPDQELQE